MRYSIMGATPEQLRSIGLRNIKQFRHIPVLYAELTATQVQKLRSEGCTVSEANKVKADVSAPVAPPVPIAAVPTYTAQEVLGLARFEEVHQMFDPPVYGEGQNMAIIDTGIRENHQLINGRVIYRKNYTSDPMRDGFDHGTGVASLAVAVVPEAGILNLKVMGDNGVGAEETVVEAIDDCVDFQGTMYAPCVINLSLGSLDDNNPNNALRVACRAAMERGIYVLASAGNGGPNPETVTNPACEQYVIAVGSARYLPDQEAYSVSEWSSRGPTKGGITKPDSVMFGEDIVMASSKSDTATAAKSGTSFATPFISGFGVLYVTAMVRWVPGMTHEFPGVIPGITEIVTPTEMVDVHFPPISLRSQEGKSNEVGWGLLFGPLVVETLAPEAVGITDISALLPAILTIGMMGMMAKVIKR